MTEPDMFILLRAADNERDTLLLETTYYGGLRVSELVDGAPISLVQQTLGHGLPCAPQPTGNLCAHLRA
jgi:site-specific recombinase XerD